jgi:RHH-type transcriptional regulator, proline utilization regulon repressor / proline dehydrogenase / delta 1-pyrroline-5-carboxylate dehydrogenase
LELLMETSRFIAQAKFCLSEVAHAPLSEEQLKDKAIQLAELMLSEAWRIETSEEKKRRQELAKMMSDPTGKSFVTSMSDQCFRSQNPKRVANQIDYLLKKFGIPSFLSWNKRVQLKAFCCLSSLFPDKMVALTRHMLRKESSSMIKPEAKILQHLRIRKQEGVRVNINHVGEAILGEKEAEKRLETYLQDLANPMIECISVKISSLYSQINLLGWHDTLHILETKLKRLYRAAKENLYTLPNGTKIHKLVTLDMEEYREVHLTVELFKNVLNDAEFYDYVAGIVLQSYLPDAFLFQQVLTVWALQRTVSGGAPIKIRLVKGANLAMEKVEASLHQWKPAPYQTKKEVDANFKRMLNYGCDLERSKAVQLGVGSHNLFDIAYAMVLKSQRHLGNAISFEMLEGMADSMRQVVQHLSGTMLLYCPTTSEANFQNAFAYLVRRMDENTAPENFLRCMFDLKAGSEEWKKQSALFSESLLEVPSLSYLPRRQQNRFFLSETADYHSPFENEPDTDWSLPQNRHWIEGIIREWKNKKIEKIPLALGKETTTELEFEKGVDPSTLSVIYEYAVAGDAELEIALEQSIKGFKKWSKKSVKERLLLLDKVAVEMRHKRGDLIGAMVADTAKTIPEADVEVSEAIDFVCYYRRNMEQFHFIEDLNLSPKGAVAVLPPWNFPCSIPTSGIVAALAAGNSVIFKPAPEAVLVGWVLVQIFWEAGVDKQTLQFFPCRDEPVATRLIQDARIAAVVLTGGTNTAKYLLSQRPGLDLLAETGGKNAMIISSMADRDLAVKDLVQSAFGYAGQKCSACSLAIVEKEVYEDADFKKQLRDAVLSLKTGSAWNASTRINPLIRPAGEALLRGLTTLDEGETWLVEPKQDEHHPHLWSPGVKIGVKKGSFFHQTELFGPVLGVMCANNLKEAIELANSTPYGLTSGIHTLDEREQQFWEKHIVAGNCYINRTITGAIVRRQPFGGCKESSFGRGAKAGGPNYVLQFLHAEQKELPKHTEALSSWAEFDEGLLQKSWSAAEVDLWKASLGSYAFYWAHHFSKREDPSFVLGQNNFFFYKSHLDQVMRIQQKDQTIDFLRATAAALISHAYLEVSLPKEHFVHISKALELKRLNKLILTIETDEELIQRIENQKIKRIRWLSSPSDEAREILSRTACNTIISPVLANGRLELLNYLREVSLSKDYHRYGYIPYNKII